MKQSPGLKMLVVCQDEEYLKSIEYRLAQALADKADISYISDYECLKEYNAQPKDIDILLIEEKLYQEVIKRQNCRNVYLLVEDEKKADRQEKAAEELLKNVKKSEFEYFPAWKRMLPAYGITTEHLLKIAACIQKKNLYDYMIVELSCEVQETKLNFLYQSDRVVLVTKQDRKTVEKLKQFMTDVVEWKGLGILVCNFYDSLQENCLTEERGKLRYTVCEYIEKLDTAPELQTLTNMHILEKTAMAVS